MTQKSCFVLMPFASRFKEIYTEVYRPVCEANGMRCWRVDEVSRPGSISRDIIEGILDADVVIADLTTKNANVFYELGITHSTGNKAIMTAQSRDDVPFDIANYRVIFYEHTLNGSKELYAKLDSAIKELVVALDRTNNPLQEVLATRGGIKQRGRTPLLRAIPFQALSKAVKSYFSAKRIIYVEDLERVDLDELLEIDGFGKDSLSQMCFLLLELNAYSNLEKLHDFVVSHRVDTRYNSLAREMRR